MTICPMAVRFPDTEMNSNDALEMLLMEERLRLAEDLHDIIGYTLTTAIVQIDGIRRLMASDPELGVQKLDTLYNHIRYGLSDVRNILQSQQDDSFEIDLKEALYRLLDKTREATGAEIAASISGKLHRLTPYQKKIIYNTVQEGLTNGIRHGRSSRFALSLIVSESRVKLTLSNNGAPFDQSSPGIGLTAMHRRIASIGGKLQLSSSESEGCCLQASFPTTPSSARSPAAARFR